MFEPNTNNVRTIFLKFISSNSFGHLSISIYLYLLLLEMIATQAKVHVVRLWRPYPLIKQDTKNQVQHKKP